MAERPLEKSIDKDPLCHLPTPWHPVPGWCGHWLRFADIADIMHERGITIRHNFVGNLFTSLDMKGVTLTVMKLDAELDRLMSHPAHAIGLTRVARPCAKKASGGS